ncbi:methyltransferase domain-containing protein [Usitatibacter palustris]|uniref:Methyltransferase type 11 domain-containing protein n=1 Tax=Usitatibacter palustris TaxID=2732487 RepID=A0A6M4HBA4_9PROT|nr:methyltransferase domain-containing protein [Usitatibacter palustris]QJR16492.1 hypothetical protein DSM104440_03327 [Usitatibacter palustris]
MQTPNFEQSGWARVDISAPAQARIAEEFAAAGVAIETLDISDYTSGFSEWRTLAEYGGAYKSYAGDLDYCVLEKALEHYLSVVVAGPKSGMTAVDIGSCQSVVPTILRRVYGVRCLEQDLSYPAGVHGDRVGSSADSIPLADGSVDFMTLHCTFEHFEGHADSGFVAECARLLGPSGRVVILPLYLNATHCNVTGITDPSARAQVTWDPDAEYFCEIPEWQNRFGRHYSVRAVLDRVIAPAWRAGLHVRLVKVVNWSAVDPNLWLRWMLILERAPTAGSLPAAQPNAPHELRALLDEVRGLREAAAAQAARTETLGRRIEDLIARSPKRS